MDVASAHVHFLPQERDAQPNLSPSAYEAERLRREAWDDSQRGANDELDKASQDADVLPMKERIAALRALYARTHARHASRFDCSGLEDLGPLAAARARRPPAGRSPVSGGDKKGGLVAAGCRLRGGAAAISSTSLTAAGTHARTHARAHTHTFDGACDGTSERTFDGTFDLARD